MATMVKQTSRRLACGMAFHTSSALFASYHQYKVDRIYNTPYKELSQNNTDGVPLYRALCEIDYTNFPSLSQARKAIQHGRLIVLCDDGNCNRKTSVQSTSSFEEIILDLGIVANQSTTLQNSDIVALRSRSPDEFYPQSCTKYVEPPLIYSDPVAARNTVVFEDEHIAIVNKAEGLDTIGEKRNDLQSILPFILHPPTEQSKPRKNMKLPCYIPRPIHRLDKRTSGCVLVAKSELAMKRFSIMFAERKIQKAYCAIVFGEPKQQLRDDCIEVDGKTFSMINYPIDGKDAQTLWRVVATVTSPQWGQLSLLHLLPKTGRNHQIRRHLSYCLAYPIVGDIKYDGGGALAKKSRELGMFLCSNSIKFEHASLDDDTRDLSVKIPLPDKFYELLDLDKDNHVLQTF